uniref:Uncharacterized protein n=1 Tax=Triticum aestivum TaxID=4565 RepID=A0A182BG03_WHEAT|nr:hypothetical protein AEX81_00003 [Triticum aestivum]
MAAAQAPTTVCCPSRLEHSAGSEQEGSGAAAVPGDQLADGEGGRPLAVAQDGGVVGGEETPCPAAAPPRCRRLRAPRPPSASRWGGGGGSFAAMDLAADGAGRWAAAAAMWNAGSWPLPPIYYGPPSEAFHVDWRNKDGVVDMEHYSTELFAAMDKHSILSVHRCTRPQFGPNVSAEYVLDPIFEDTFLANPRFSYLLPLIGHKVGTTTGYWQCDGSIEVPVREVAALKISDN